MDKRLKTLIKDKKISDEALLAFAEAFTVESVDTDENPDAPDTSAGETVDGDREAFTEKELKAMIDKAVAEAKANDAPAQPLQTDFSIVNDRKEPRFRVLKMNNR